MQRLYKLILPNLQTVLTFHSGQQLERAPTGYAPRFFGKCSMPDTAPDTYASRWQAMLVENSALQKHHLDLLSSLVPPFSAPEQVQFEASTARFVEFNLKLRTLVYD